MKPPHYLVAIAITLACSGLSANDKQPPPLPKDTLPQQLDVKFVPRGLTATRPVPSDNPLTAERVELGRRLFFDPVLSADGTVACATCHRPDHGFASSEPIAVGIKGRKGTRNAPSLLNRAFGSTFFWDGRSVSLEEQAIKPIVNEVELGNTFENLLKTLRGDKTMVAAFDSAFADSAGSESNTVSKENIGRALAAFQRTLLLGNSPIDAFQMGNHAAMNAEERQGFWLFESRGGCWKCHSGVNYSDEQFHNTGISFGSKTRDTGRFQATNKDEDKFAFKTPTLRGVALTAPYMHDGSVKTLHEVVEFYNKGGSRDDPGLDSRMEPLGLSPKEVKLLVACLKALSRDADQPLEAK
ncbi:MAG: cytochrome-c peroxidase [Planctomycetaceae bacterium]